MSEKIQSLQTRNLHSTAPRLSAERPEKHDTQSHDKRHQALTAIDNTRAALKKSGSSAMAGMIVGWVPLVGTALSIPQRVRLNSAAKKIKAFRSQHPELSYVTRDIENQTKSARTAATFGIALGVLPMAGSLTSAQAYTAQQSALTALDRVRDLVNRHGAAPDNTVIDNFTQRVEAAQNMRALAGSVGHAGNGGSLLAASGLLGGLAIGSAL